MSVLDDNMEQERACASAQALARTNSLILTSGFKPLD
jgi:hypothetical protein